MDQSWLTSSNSHNPFLEERGPSEISDASLFGLNEIERRLFCSHSQTQRAGWLKKRQKTKLSAHLGRTGMRDHDLPTVIKLLEVHGGVPYHRLLGTRERDRPPGEG
jgi:hypothetical protein